MTIRYHKRTDGLYELEEEYRYVSPRYGKSVYIPKGQVRDGATGAKDVEGAAWWVHDQLCADTVWEDGTPCTPWQAATVLGDILRSEGYWLIAMMNKPARWQTHWCIWLPALPGDRCSEYRRLGSRSSPVPS